MTASSAMADRAYTNVMERLVAEEVARQKAKLPPKLREYIKGVEVETYALNRLPALYASSEKGWQVQYEKAGKTQWRNGSSGSASGNCGCTGRPFAGLSAAVSAPK